MLTLPAQALAADPTAETLPTPLREAELSVCHHPYKSDTGRPHGTW